MACLNKLSNLACRMVFKGKTFQLRSSLRQFQSEIKQNDQDRRLLLQNSSSAAANGQCSCDPESSRKFTFLSEAFLSKSQEFPFQP
jgi:hypothetical protein